MARPYDLIVFGATGDAGRAIARYLGGAAPPSLKWAIGGRSVSKLEKVRASVRAACPKATFDVVIASCDDDASMAAMTRSARLVLSAAGPYEKLGEVDDTFRENDETHASSSGAAAWLGIIDRPIRNHYTHPRSEPLRGGIATNGPRGVRRLLPAGDRRVHRGRRALLRHHG
jgi:hypothetical protein